MTARAVAVALAAGVDALAPAPAAQGQDGAGPQPTATVVQQAAAVADVVDVVGAGWQPGDLVAVALCGNEAARGSIDCLPHAREVGVGPDGTFPRVPQLVVTRGRERGG